jgi:hypothetical protein
VRQAEALRTFSRGCERLLLSIRTNGALAEDEARIVEYYCKEILAKIGAYGKSQSNSS